MPRISRQLLLARLIDHLDARAAGNQAANGHTPLEEIRSDQEFVNEAYRRILGRQPELGSLEHFIRVLRTQPRSVVLDCLLEARDGPNTATPANSAEQAPSPDPPSSPRIEAIDASSLESVRDPDEFVYEMYGMILGRSPDLDGFANYRSLLLAGVTRVDLVALVADSAEARARNLPVLWGQGPIQRPTPLSITSKVRVRLSRWFRPARTERLSRTLRQLERESEFRKSQQRFDVELKQLGREGSHMSAAIAGVMASVKSLAASSDASQSAVTARLSAGAEAVSSLANAIHALRLDFSASRHQGTRLQAEAVRSLDMAVHAINLEISASREQGARLQAETVRYLDMAVHTLNLEISASREQGARLQAEAVRSLDMAVHAINLEISASREQGARLQAETVRYLDMAVHTLNLEISASREQGARLQAEAVSSLDMAVHALNLEVSASREQGARLQADFQGFRQSSTDQTLRLQNQVADVRQCLADQTPRLAEAIESLGQRINSLQAQFRAPEASARELAMLDAIALNLEIRGDDMRRAIDAATRESATQWQSVHEIYHVLKQAARPPVLAGRDVFVMKVDDFVFAVAREDWTLAALYAFWGAVERGLTLYLQSILRPGMVFVDIGANVGIHTLHAARLVGATGVVHAFEPDPKTFEILSQNVHANGLQASIQLHRQALLDHNGELPLYRAAGMSSWNSVFAGDDERTSVIVPCSTLDEALGGSSRIDVIKLDAEGAEPAILRGMSRVLERNPEILILMEYAPPHLQRAGVSASGFLDQLTTDGFQIAAVDDATGELSEVNREQLPSAFSINLALRKSPTPPVPPAEGEVPKF